MGEPSETRSLPRVHHVKYTNVNTVRILLH